MRSIYLLPILVLAHMNTYAQAPTIIPIPRSQAEQDKARKKQDDDRLQRETEQKKTNQSLKDALAKSEADKKQLADQAATEKKAREKAEGENAYLKKNLQEAQKAQANKQDESKTAIVDLKAQLEQANKDKDKLSKERDQFKTKAEQAVVVKPTEVKDPIVSSTSISAPTLPTYQALSQFQDDLKGGGKGPDMIWMPAGEFDMGSLSGVGSNDEHPQRKGVKVAAFAMAKTEVTVKQYLLCADANKCDQPEWKTSSTSYYKERNGLDEQSPITGVSWHNAVQYATWLSNVTGQIYHLPSEAQWEYACKAGQNTTHCGSDRVEEVAWVSSNSQSKMHAVAQKVKNAWGVYDMSGNAWEWTLDCWHDSYQGASKVGSVWAGGDCSYRAVRGGSWSFSSDVARAAIRSYSSPGDRLNDIGFRVARTAR